ncbi:MAG: carbohydrate kinase family protein [Thermoguttaceae bacterium]
MFVGIGEILWDLLPGGRQFGGAPANFAYHAKALGSDAQVVSCVGRDELGDEVLAYLDRLGLGHEHIAVDPEHPTGTVSVRLDALGKPDYVIHEKVAWDHLNLLPQTLGLATRADAVCFGSLAQRSCVSRLAIRDFLAATRPECLRVFDVNLRQHYYNVDTIAVGLEAADVLKLNDEELLVIARLLSIHGAVEEMLSTLCRRYHLKLIALTEGDRGSLLFSPRMRSRHAGHLTQVVDTVGAGDAFTAVLAFGLLSGASLDAINEQANCAASFVCSRAGATPEMLVAEIPWQQNRPPSVEW